MPNPNLVDLEAVIDADGYDWLVTYAPTYITAISKAIAAGETPQTIRAYVAQRVGPDRFGLALRCEQAARHIMRTNA